MKSNKSRTDFQEERKFRILNDLSRPITSISILSISNPSKNNFLTALYAHAAVFHTHWAWRMLIYVRARSSQVTEKKKQTKIHVIKSKIIFALLNFA